MKKDKVRFGVIGCGNVAPTYLYTLEQHPRAEVVALVDPDYNRLNSRGDEFAIRSRYECYKSMIEKEDLDAVVIASPHYLHHEQAIYCAKKGCDVLCEKPLATNMENLVDMIEKCSDVRFGVMVQRRLYPNTIAAKEAYGDGKLGEIKEVKVDFSCHKSAEFYSSWRGQAISGGGVLISQSLHRIDQAVSIFGKPFVVQGITEKNRSCIEVEDYARGSILFERDVTVKIEANNFSGNEETISEIKIYGSNCLIYLSDDKVKNWHVPGMNKPKGLDINAIPTRHRPAYYGPGHEIIINDFIDSIVEDRQPILRGEDTLDTMKAIFGFYESARNEGRRIVLDELFV